MVNWITYWQRTILTKTKDNLIINCDQKNNPLKHRMASKDNITTQSRHKAENKTKIKRKTLPHKHACVTTADLQNIASLTPSVCSQKKKNPSFSFSFLLRLIICCCPSHGWTGTQTRQPRGLGRQQKEDGVKSQGIYFSQAPQEKKGLPFLQKAKACII